MIKTIDSYLNKITMYQAALFEVIFLLACASILSYFGFLSFTPLYLGFSIALIFATCYITNWVFARVFEAPSNPESTYITALILALIISPPHAFFDTSYLVLALWASAWAIASKYIFAIGNKHLFNPAAMGAVLPSLLLGVGASWWIGTPSMLPFVLVGGLLVVRKIRRFDLLLSFSIAAILSVSYFAVTKNTPLFDALSHLVLYAPSVFFATVMLTEPLTSPGSRLMRILYGVLVGLLFAPDIQVLGLYSTPELALIVGNVFSYLVSPKQKLLLTLKQRTRLTHDTYEFGFAASKPFSFKPGQYMEWTLPHEKRDRRGMRRYFTVASAPSEDLVRVGVKFYAPASSFKKSLAAMRAGERIVASQLAGDFTLPRNREKPLVFIAGGIGITPFRSMLQHLLDTGEKRPITLLYSVRTTEDIAYADILREVQVKLGVKVIYAITDPSAPLPAHERAVRTIHADTIMKEIPEWHTATFYISGPQAMVAAYNDMLQVMGIARRRIKKDFFPGFA